jgi:hypothetical protein
MLCPSIRPTSASTPHSADLITGSECGTNTYSRFIQMQNMVKVSNCIANGNPSISIPD